MSNIAGIKFTKDSKNENRYVTIDLKKHGELFNPLLTKVGALEEDEFEKKWKEGISGDEFWGKIEKTIRNHFNGKKCPK